MAISQNSGPFLAAPYGGTSFLVGSATSPFNGPESAPSLFHEGIGLFDPRYGYRNGGGSENKALLACGLGPSLAILTVDAAPSASAAANVAVAAAVTSGTAMTLVSTTSSSITVLSSATTITQTGLTVPSGTLAIDGAPGLVLYGTQQSIALADPTKAITRAVKVTGLATSAGGAFLVSGYDLYGFPQTELITANASATPVNGKKGFKFISSIVPQFSDSATYSWGTSDVFQFPMRVDTFVYARIGWAGSLISASTGFTAAVTTTATNTTGDVRGTYTVQSSSDGTKTLQMFISVSAANISSLTGYFGVAPA